MCMEYECVSEICQQQSSEEYRYIYKKHPELIYPEDWRKWWNVIEYKEQSHIYNTIPLIHP